MANSKDREKAVHSLIRQQSVILDDLIREHGLAKNRLDEAKLEYANVLRVMDELESQIRDTSKEGVELSLNMLQWQRNQLYRQNSLLNERKNEKHEAQLACEKKYEELIEQKRKIESFEKLSERYRAERRKKSLLRSFHELDALSAQKR